MTTYVLIHGGWVGGWWWSRLAPLLRAAGHTVFTPTLTGLGERVHLASREINLETHIRDVLGVLEYEDLRGVTLLGHSYGGAVLSSVAERAPARVRELVYLDAFALRHGESVAGAVGAELMAAMQHFADAEGEGWRVPFPYPEESMGAGDGFSYRFHLGRRVMHPMATFTDRVRLARPPAIPQSFLLCRVRPVGFFEQFARRAQQEGWRYAELDTTHAGPVTEPEKVAAALLGLA